MRHILLLFAAGAIAGCTATITPVEATRFHLGQPIAAGAVAIVAGSSLETAAYTTAVRQALARIGFGDVAAGQQHNYLAKVSVEQTRRDQLKRAPVSIGIGGGSFGGGLGVGLSTQFGVGGGARQIVTTRLSVQLIRTADATAVWEGRAETTAPVNSPAGQNSLAAQKLASALFKDFPGTSGQTITVP